MTDDGLLFDPDDDAALSAILSRAMQPEWRQAVVAQQGSVWPRFRTAEVARLFWSAMQDRADAMAGHAASPLPEPDPAGARPASFLQRRRPRVAMLSPVPPDRSGVADYTAACCEELGRRVDLHVFTETRDPRPIANTTISPLSALPFLSSEFDRVIGVMGNSHFHRRIFELLMRYGGACICHDVRLAGFYGAFLGHPHALATASAELGRPVMRTELDGWLADESKLEATFLGEVAAVAEPLLLHSPPVARIVADRFGTTPVCLPFSIYRPWTAEELGPRSRQAARRRLGIPEGELLIATFGFISGNKGPQECIWALDALRGWHLPARLAFVGASLMDLASLLRLRTSLDLEEYVTFAGEFASEAVYRDYLLAADYAIQLRSYGMGGLSGALLDCIAAGVPSVANKDMADAMEAPGYVRRIPNYLAPLLVAEEIADMVAKGRHLDRNSAERRVFEASHNFSAYAEQLCETLGFSTQAR